jgi:hypothetical protein
MPDPEAEDSKEANGPALDNGTQWKREYNLPNKSLQRMACSHR